MEGYRDGRGICLHAGDAQGAYAGTAEPIRRNQHRLPPEGTGHLPVREPAGAAQTNGGGGKQEQHLQECRHVLAQQDAAAKVARTEKFLEWSKIKDFSPETISRPLQRDSVKH